MMRQADEEAFHGLPEWQPLENRLDRQIQRNDAQLEDNRRMLREPGIEDDYEDIRRGGSGGAF